MNADLTNQEDPEADSMVDHPADWLDSAQSLYPDSPESDLGDGGYLRPWKTADI
jgi:hypothetical protein